MKAFLLAAGHGTRLKPLTDTAPKCLLPIRGVPLLEIWLNLCSLHGIDDVLINVHAHPAMVRKFAEENKSGVKIRLSEEETLLGSAGTLRANRDWLGDAEEFAILYGDVLTNANLSSLVEFHRQKKQIATIALYEVTNPTKCGIVTTDKDGIVRDFVEKPANPTSNCAFTGLMIATPAIFDLIPSETPADIGFHVLPKLVGRMAALPIKDFLVDIGTPEKYEQVQTTWPGLYAGPRLDDRK
jgi:mannose-1-phosphate guanylyltransferase